MTPDRHEMTPAQYERVHELFEEACGVAPGERDRLVRRAASDDPAVRDKVLAMLAHDEPGSSALETPALGIGFDVSIALDEPIPEQIGRYRIESLVGEGGMGRVYKGTQPEPRRTVAVKLLRPGARAPELLQRFRFEVHVLGRLQHPGIAQIFEAGTYDAGHGAQPFFAMEFVDGRPLRRYSDEEALGPRQRVELMVRICDAVHHAHQRGIVHRDLKPDNILVDANGQPKVLDFGVARLVDADADLTMAHTSAGQLVGTLAYMSPEQVAGAELDSRTDVYALGVIAFELLTGSLPYAVKRTTMHEAARTIIEASPATLGSFNRGLRGDLETVVATALRKEPERRYQSAAALGDDFRRFLNHEPIAARAPTAMYHLSRFARRHRALTASVVVAAIALIGGTAASVYSLQREHRQRLEAESQKAIALGINAFLTDDLLAALQLEHGGFTHDVTMREVLDAAAERIGDRFGDQPVVEASIQQTMGSCYLSLGEFAKAQKHLERALTLSREHLGSNDLRTIDCLDLLGSTLKEWGRFDQAIVCQREALERCQDLLDENDERLLEAMNNLASTLAAGGREEEALPVFRAALEKCERLYGPDHVGTLAIKGNLAVICSNRGQLDQAITLNEEVLASRRRLYGDLDPQTLIAMKNLGSCYARVDRDEEARALYDEAIEGYRKVLGPDHATTLWTERFLGSLLKKQGRLEEAEALMRDVVTRAHEHLEPDEWTRGTFLGLHGSILRALGRTDEAEPELRAAVDLLEKTRGNEFPATQSAISELAALCEETGRPEEAATFRARLVERPSDRTTAAPTP
ncbi:MAG: serine/threonine protein kinase [Phycisphaerales bacterium]|nr:serine/threonine protein kinase [Phycisphaerales bacterium]